MYRRHWKRPASVSCEDSENLIQTIFTHLQAIQAEPRYDALGHIQILEEAGMMVKVLLLNKNPLRLFSPYITNADFDEQQRSLVVEAYMEHLDSVADKLSSDMARRVEYEWLGKSELCSSLMVNLYKFFGWTLNDSQAGSQCEIAQALYKPGRDVTLNSSAKKAMEPLLQRISGLKAYTDDRYSLLSPVSSFLDGGQEARKSIKKIDDGVQAGGNTSSTNTTGPSVIALNSSLGCIPILQIWRETLPGEGRSSCRRRSM